MTMVFGFTFRGVSVLEEPTAIIFHEAINSHFVELISEIVLYVRLLSAQFVQISFANKKKNNFFTEAKT